MNALNNDTNPRWILFGGSYAGTLAAAMRVRYPDLSIGAIASSAPMQAVTDFYGYKQMVEKQVNTYGDAECAEGMRKMFYALQRKMNTEDGRFTVKKEFCLYQRLARGELRGREGPAGCSTPTSTSILDSPCSTTTRSTSPPVLVPALTRTAGAYWPTTSHLRATAADDLTNCDSCQKIGLGIVDGSSYKWNLSFPVPSACRCEAGRRRSGGWKSGEMRQIRRRVLAEESDMAKAHARILNESRHLSSRRTTSLSPVARRQQ